MPPQIASPAALFVSQRGKRRFSDVDVERARLLYHWLRLDDGSVPGDLMLSACNRARWTLAWSTGGVDENVAAGSSEMASTRSADSHAREPL